MAATETTTKWHLKAVGYEFCNCAPGCTCNFSGFPSSKDGRCKAFVGNVIKEGKCGDVDLSGLTCAAVFDWPKAIHDGNGKAVFIVPTNIRDEQLDALAKIFTGQLKGCPGRSWALPYLSPAWRKLTSKSVPRALPHQSASRAWLRRSGRHSRTRSPASRTRPRSPLTTASSGSAANVELVLSRSTRASSTSNFGTRTGSSTNSIGATDEALINRG